MTAAGPQDGLVAQWWATAVSRVEPGIIELREHPVQDLIGRTTFVETIWLMLRGELPRAGQAGLLEAALVAGVDHGPQAPSIAAARMAATCGVGLNSAMATGVNMLGDVHGGAGQQCVELLDEIVERYGRDAARPTRDAEQASSEAEFERVVAEVVAEWRARSRYLPGFGHRFHPRDPRRDPLLALVDRAVADGLVAGAHLRAARAVEELLNRGREGGRPVPMNIDGATAVVYAELGFAAPLARGLFVLSRSVGILAHAWEETGQGRRNKSPMPPSMVPVHLVAPTALP
ncbi:citryl-CoA lyase [Streptomyces tauricus]|uniref:citrate synthase (unknown stereospecificity) n=1 Tax=Streptomyces tauricus TaxID=68274 RepID=A0ABZ1JTA9_9ACTN|nr:citryl-CoA lyase [Streptomyces tauricus]MCW8096179.1 citryl-CoA lyase [Streptomyces tauricus]GHA06362.1 citryl-CoA lyase [Streptomyces tauricus]